ncbi:DUF6519 domain-containing protein [Actinophytocola sp.]|uniref:DUF6519 domain-containing protein n=1 Tax=Actinophytocola sp. TaxID=1872138 RepID=UPI00389AEF36
MATMTPSSFDPLKRYVNVRLQQGVPIVDADMNELDDVRKFELRAFLKWFVGDGVPEGNDGFRIAPVTSGSADNDFLVSVGAAAPPANNPVVETGLRNVGRLVLDGLDVIIDRDLRFTDQALHENKTGAAALAAKWGVPVVTKLANPTADGTLVVYLDMWERLVTADEAPELVRAGLGVETCARTRREWVVRVGAAMPTPAEAVAGHGYYQLATLARHNGVAAVAAADLTDRRERRLLVPPAHLLADTVGLAADGNFDPLAYRRGGGRPAISLRDAINSLLAGRVPTTSDISVSPGANTDALKRAVLVDPAGGLIVFWEAPRGNGGSKQIMGARLDLARPDLNFDAKLITNGATASDQSIEPTAVALPGAGILLAYQNGATGNTNTNVVMRRASTFAGLSPAGSPQDVANTGGVSDDSAHVVVIGDTVVFFTYQQTSSNPHWVFRRYKYLTDSFPDTALQQLSTVVPTTRDFHAAAGGTVVWTAFGDGVNIQVVRLNPTNAGTDANTISAVGPAAGGSTFTPFVLAVSTLEAQVFYSDLNNSPKGLRVAAYTNGTSAAPAISVIPGTDENETNPVAVQDTEGNIFLFSSRTVTGAQGEIVMRRRNAGSSDWSQAQRVSPHAASDIRPHALFVPGSGIWVFWMSDRAIQGNFDLYAKRVITAI